MADYRLTATDEAVIGMLPANGPGREATEAHIPNAPGNKDWEKYQEWLAAGGVPDPYVEPPPPPPTPGQEVAFDHENRIRTLEGQPPLTMQEFSKRTKK